MAEFDYQWKHTLEKEDLENEEEKYECNEKRIDEFLTQFKNKKWFSKKPSFKGKNDVMLLLKKVSDPRRFGVAIVTKKKNDFQVINVEEKPKKNYKLA